MRQELSQWQFEKLIEVYQAHKQDIILCSRKPYFLNKVSDFIEGAMSYPEGWWAANFQVIALTGILGKHEQANAKLRQAILSNILSQAIYNKEITLYIIKQITTYKLQYHAMQIIGRLAGALATNWLLLSRFKSKLRYSLDPKFSRPISLGVNVLQFAYVSYGTAMLAIAKGFRSISPIISGIVTGDVANLNFYPDISTMPKYTAQELLQMNQTYQLQFELVTCVAEIN